MSAIASQTHARAGNAPVKPGPRFEAALASFGLDAALARARRHLLSLQKSDGHWVGELQGDTILESETVMLLAFLGHDDGDDRIRKAGNYLVQQQRAQGAWSNYPGGPVDLNVSVKA